MILVTGATGNVGGELVRALAGPRHPGEQVGPPSQSERRPLHHRLPAQRREGPELGDGGVHVVEFLPGQLRAAEEQVIMRVADPQLSG